MEKKLWNPKQNESFCFPVFSFGRPVRGLGDCELGDRQSRKLIKFQVPLGVGRESPERERSGRGSHHFRAAWAKEVPRADPGCGGRSWWLRRVGPRSAAWAWLGGWLPAHRLGEARLWPLGLVALLQAPEAPAFQLTLLPQIQGLFPERKRDPAGPQPV